MTPEEIRARQDAVYAAEESWSEDHAYEHHDVRLTAAEATDLMVRAMHNAGLPGDPPGLVLDVDGGSEWAGYFDPSTGAIHIHPVLLNPLKVLHELAHAVCPADGHGAGWAAAHVSLVAAELGDHLAEALLAAYAEHGVEVRAGASWHDG